MGRWINADTKRTVILYDDEREEFISKRMTIEEMCYAYTEEGIPIIFSGLRVEKWILTSERLPEVEVDVLVSINKFNSKYTDIAYMLYDSETGEYWFGNHLASYEINEVEAWMPLPAPLELGELKSN